MNVDQIETVLVERLEGMTACPPIAWQNKDAKPSLPYLRFRHEPTAWMDPTLGGAGAVAMGLALITVVTARDKFTGPSLVLAQAIADRFPYLLTLELTAGRLLIYKPTDILGGFNTDAGFERPVRVSYRTLRY